jgi:hypothetical protein
MEYKMKKIVKIMLLPEAGQVQVLIDTIDMYNGLCNRISEILYRLYTAQPINKYRLEIVEKNNDIHHAVHLEFPYINAKLIPLAFRKVTRYYKYRDTPKNAYVFSGILDCNSYLISIKSNFKQPNNIGVLTINTLAGLQEIKFTFNDAKREELAKGFSRMGYGEYILSYKNDKFYLSTIIKEDQIKPTITNIMQDHDRKAYRRRFF